MKCHRVLGIEESASESAISQAYQKKVDYLYSNESDCPEMIKEKKAEELLAAKNDCIRWLSSTGSEKLSLRIRETRESFTNPNVMYTSPIGCCSGCVSACGSDSCCKSCCGDDCVSCANKVDIGLYVMIGLAIIGGIISLISKITPKIRESNERNKIARRDEAVADNQRLQVTLNQANSQLKAANDNLAAVASEYDKVVAFCNFFRVIGCADCTSIIAVQQGTVTAARTQIYNAHENASRIQAQMRRNDDIIHRQL